MNSVLVTGVAGFIGSHINQDLLDRGCRVIGVDNLSSGYYSHLPSHRKNLSLFDFYDMDVCDPNMIDIFAAQRPEVVYHCAAMPREGTSPFQPFEITRTNILASVHILELGLRYGMKRYTFLSSMSVYGNQKSPFDEKMRRKPADPYGTSKSGTEQIIEQLAEVHDFEYCIIRPHNVIGPGLALNDKYRGVAGIFINSVMRKEPIYIYGKDHKRAFSNIKDCLPCFLKAAELGVANREIINLGGQEVVTVEELATEVIKNLPEYPVPEIIHLPPRPLEVEIAYCTTEKSEKLLDYKETYGWRAAIADMCEDAKQKGPQEWKKDGLPLGGENLPMPWRKI